jgi:hypothetical protein
MTIKIGTNNAKIHEVNQKQTNDSLTGRLINQHNLYNESHGLVSGERKGIGIIVGIVGIEGIWPGSGGRARLGKEG